MVRIRLATRGRMWRVEKLLSLFNSQLASDEKETWRMWTTKRVEEEKTKKQSHSQMNRANNDNQICMGWPQPSTTDSGNGLLLCLSVSAAAADMYIIKAEDESRRMKNGPSDCQPQVVEEHKYIEMYLDCGTAEWGTHFPCRDILRRHATVESVNFRPSFSSQIEWL